MLYGYARAESFCAVALLTALLPTSRLGAGSPGNHAAAGPVAPVIDRQPIARSATEGGPVALSVLVSGTSSYVCQWWKGEDRLTNHFRLTGATNSVLNINPVLRADAGDYSVVIAVGGASITSSPVSLTVTQMVIPQPTPLGATGVLVSIFALPGDVYRVESSVDFAPWVTNGYATNVTGHAQYRDIYAAGGFRRLRVAYERLLPVLHPPRAVAGAVPVYGMIGEVWRLRSSSDLESWSDVITLTNETGWIFFTNSPAPLNRFYRVVPPLL